MFVGFGVIVGRESTFVGFGSTFMGFGINACGIWGQPLWVLGSLWDLGSTFVGFGVNVVDLGSVL